MLAISPGCELHVERGPDWLLVRVDCSDPLELDAISLSEQIWSLLEQHFTYRLVLELERVTVLTSPMIGQLMQLHHRVEQHDGVMRVCGLSSHNREVLHACRVDEQLLPYHDRHEAVTGESHPRQPR
jgi:anti-anti-sigma regulatory factor